MLAIAETAVEEKGSGGGICVESRGGSWERDGVFLCERERGRRATFCGSVSVSKSKIKIHASNAAYFICV